MMELVRIRPSYETRGTEDPARFEDAHRLLRMAIAVGLVLPLSSPTVLDAFEAIERVGGPLDDDQDEHRFTTEEVAVLAEVLAQVATELDAALDSEWRPRGRGGECIEEEATRPKTLDNGSPDYDRIFEMDSEGRISTVYPRMSLVELHEELPKLMQFMRSAAARKLEVAIVER